MPAATTTISRPQQFDWKDDKRLREESSQSRENSMHQFRVRNMTLSADEDLIERARSMARGQRRTPNAAFREWLTSFTQSAVDAQGFDGLMKHLQHVDAGRQLSRDEMNGR